MVRVIGHRGAAGLEPENTLRSIKRAIDLGADEVEVDVRVTRDGHLVVIHDETVERTTDGHGYVKDLTFNEIRRLDAGLGEAVPTLEEVLNLTQGILVLNVELKVPEALRPTLRVIEEKNAESDVVVISFIHDLLGEIHRLNPQIETGALFSAVPDDIFVRASEVHAKGIYIQYRNVNAELVEEAHREGLKIGVWTVNSVEEMRRMIRMGVDAVTTDRPDILINLLRSMGLR
ncbi:MAG: glycerophosphoryl diester phosphodiesterase [Candidatus Bathyarchaeota archaeon B26-2]|nr:MAG: glycerophosphoryl diester phosphodiesterase [Candidatus Bathyarchaeota archaeon B26-2]